MKAEKLEQFNDDVDVLVGHIWRTIINHSKKGHRVRLAIDDWEQTIWCVYCGVPIVGGTDAVMNRCGEKMKAAGIEFEVIISTTQNHQ